MGMFVSCIWVKCYKPLLNAEDLLKITMTMDFIRVLSCLDLVFVPRFIIKYFLKWINQMTVEQDLECHEIAKNMPQISEEVFDMIKDNIRQLHHVPVIITYQEKILIGQYEYAFCIDNGYDYEVVRSEAKNDYEALSLISIHHIRSYRLSKSQAACFVVDNASLIERIKIENQEVKKEKLTKQYSFVKQESPTIDNANSHYLNARLARLADTSTSMIDKAMTLKKNSLELYNQVKNGDISSIPRALSILNPKIKKSKSNSDFFESQISKSFGVKGIKTEEKVDILFAVLGDKEKKLLLDKLSEDQKLKEQKKSVKNRKNTSDSRPQSIVQKSENSKAKDSASDELLGLAFTT